MSDRAAVLLSKALQSLQSAERDELLHAVLLGQLSSMGTVWPSGVTRPVPVGADIDRDRLAALLGPVLTLVEIPQSC